MRVNILIIAVWLILPACNTTAKINRQSLNDIPHIFIGTFTDDYGSTYHINNKEWIHDKKIRYHLLSYNKDSLYFIARNDEANPSDKSLYTRIDVMYLKSMDPWKWGFCLTAYKAKTFEEAVNTAAADRANPRQGCGGYPFTRMKRE